MFFSMQIRIQLKKIFFKSNKPWSWSKFTKFFKNKIKTFIKFLAFLLLLFNKIFLLDLDKQPLLKKIKMDEKSGQGKGKITGLPTERETGHRSYRG